MRNVLGKYIKLIIKLQASKGKYLIAANNYDKMRTTTGPHFDEQEALL